MKKSRFSWAIILLSLLLAGCNGGREGERQQAPDAGEQSAVSIPWREDFLEAMRVAQKENRPVLLNFTGSDWCPPCLWWNKQIFQTEEFAEYATANLILLEVDFPRDRKQSAEVVQQNQVLSSLFGVEDFPTLIVLSPDGEELQRISGVLPEGPRDFVTWLRRGRDPSA